MAGRQQGVGPGPPDGRNQPGTQDLVLGPCRRQKGVRTIQQVLGPPELWPPTREQELLGKIHDGLLHTGIDAPYEGGRDPLRVRTVAGPFRVEVATKLHPPRHRIPLDEVRAEDLSEATLHRSPPQIHLKQPVLRLDESLDEEEIVFAFSRDVGYTPGVTHHAYRAIKALEDQRARGLGKARTIRR